MQQRIEDAFVPLYQQLRAIAQMRLAGSDSATLQATAVVHEALMRLSGRSLESFASEQHILATAAQVIRHVVIDHARKKKLARTSSVDASSLLEQVAGPMDGQRTELLLDLDAAMSELKTLDPELTTIVELHTFGGLTHAEIAALLNCSERTTRRRWQYAAAVLRSRLQHWSESLDARPNND